MGGVRSPLSQFANPLSLYLSFTGGSLFSFHRIWRDLPSPHQIISHLLGSLYPRTSPIMSQREILRPSTYYMGACKADLWIGVIWDDFQPFGCDFRHAILETTALSHTYREWIPLEETGSFLLVALNCPCGFMAFKKPHSSLLWLLVTTIRCTTLWHTIK